LNESGYTIRSAHAEELTMLAQIERSAAVLFLDTPYAFLANDEPLSLDFVQQTIGFQQIRRQEMEAGLPISDRVIMFCDLQPLGKVIR
jgi:hypothetical protein